jgi:two-component system cell cycle sensor histidine kinase/response regulator CckA
MFFSSAAIAKEKTHEGSPDGFIAVIVEDEPAVLRMLEFAPRHYGFEVRGARSGPQAVEIYRRHHAEVDAVLLDVPMPETDGPQTLAALREIDRGVRCVFMSGNTGEYTAEQRLALGAARVLLKPSTGLAGLMRVLREGAQQRED